MEFNDIEECTAVSADMHRVFSHQFIQFGSTVLYNKYVLTPVNLPKLRCCPLSRLILGDAFLSSMTFPCSKHCYPRDPPPSPGHWSSRWFIILAEFWMSKAVPRMTWEAQITPSLFWGGGWIIRPMAHKPSTGII